MTNIFIEKVQQKVDDIFPTKIAKIPINNKPWFNHKLRQLSAKKKAIFKKEEDGKYLIINYQNQIKEKDAL